MSKQFDLVQKYDCVNSALRAAKLACFFCMSEIIPDKMVKVNESVLSVGNKCVTEKCSIMPDCEVFKYAENMLDRNYGL